MGSSSWKIWKFFILKISRFTDGESLFWQMEWVLDCFGCVLSILVVQNTFWSILRRIFEKISPIAQNRMRKMPFLADFCCFLHWEEVYLKIWASASEKILFGTKNVTPCFNQILQLQTLGRCSFFRFHTPSRANFDVRVWEPKTNVFLQTSHLRLSAAKKFSAGHSHLVCMFVS